MQLSSLVFAILSLFFFDFGLASSLLRPSILNYSETSSALKPADASEVNVAANIPKRRGNQYLLITSNDRNDYGDDAKELAVLVCDQMLRWLKQLAPAAIISDRHWEHQSLGDLYAADYSIFMNLVPLNTHQDRHADSLDRETAYFAMKEFCYLVSHFGAMEGEFEIWAYDFKLSISRVYIFKWPVGYNST
ncbi:MAG: hypothetical protein Q9191_005539 [Dirinaria sp. TL-2023a]